MRSELSLRRRGESGRFPVVELLTLALLAIAPPASAADNAASLELFHGPDDTGSMVLKTLRVILDGSDLQVTALPTPSDSSRAIFAGKVAPGGHKLEVEAILERARSFFSYMDGYRIKMRSVLELEVLSGEGLTITSRVLPSGDPTAPWHERNRLVLTLSAAGGAGAAPPAEVAVAAPAPEPEATPEAARKIAPALAAAGPAGRPAEAAPRVARTAPAPSGVESGDCAPPRIHFAFDRATLTSEALESLDRFMACLPTARAKLRVEGHCDARGGDQYNLWLGWERAAAVAAYLRERGVPARRVSTRYLGKASPVCAEATAACHARNRRVEVIPVE
jgi:peptidoglycan-associated lipoprotein